MCIMFRAFFPPVLVVPMFISMLHRFGPCLMFTCPSLSSEHVIVSRVSGKSASLQWRTFLLLLVLLVKCFSSSAWTCDHFLRIYTSVDLSWCSDSSVSYCTSCNGPILCNTVFVFFCTFVFSFICSYTTRLLNSPIWLCRNVYDRSSDGHRRFV